MQKLTLILGAFALLISLTHGKEHPWVGSRIHPFQEYFDTHHKAYLTWTGDKNLHIKGIFLGDSITEGWNGFGKEYFHEHFASKGIFNYGIGADKTQNNLWRIENGEFDGLKELKMVVLMIGKFHLLIVEGKLINLLFTFLDRNQQSVGR